MEEEGEDRQTVDCNFTITAIMVIAHFDTSSPKVSFADFTAATVG